MRVLVFGASITQGYWDTQGGWVQRLRAHYDKKQVQDLTQDNPSIFNLGVSADTTRMILNRFDAETEARRRNQMAFILSAGINDSAIEAGKNRSTPEQYESELEELVRKAQKYSDKILFAELTPCDEKLTNPVPEWWHKDLCYRNERIQEFESAAQKVCEENSIPYVALFEKLKQELDSGHQILIDGLHPNDAGHELIFQLVLPELNKLIVK